MKYIIGKQLFFSALIFLFTFAYFTLGFLPHTANASTAFITTWKTDNIGVSANNQITIPTTGGGYNYNIDWGDSSTDSGVTGSITHTYVTSGTYTVTITGTFPRIYFNDGSGTDASKLLSIEQWGSSHWSTMNAAFAGCANMVDNATDIPDLSGVTNTSYMFLNDALFNTNINNWNVSTVTNMYGMFQSTLAFNQPLNSWNVSHVTDMGYMFENDPNFNQPLNSWVTTSVTSMDSMFDGDGSFNQDISSWDVSHVANFNGMFYASGFNQPVNSWVTTSATEMSGMFYATPFNQPLNNWDVSHVTRMVRMFGGAPFNQDIHAWDVSNVTDMGGMFYATPFNQPLNSWVTTSVTSMNSMFMEDHVFNQPLSSWDVSHVTDMGSMFYRCHAFNQDLSSWHTGNVTNMSYMFYQANSFAQDISSWDVSNVSNMDNMFDGDTLSNTHYDAILNAWSLETLQHNVTFDAGNSHYCTSGTARASIISTYNWTIIDGGAFCDTVATVTTDSTSSVTQTSATLYGTVSATGGDDVTVRGFDYGTTDSYGSTTTDSGDYGTGGFSADISSLFLGTTYHYRSYATNSKGTSYGVDKMFTTPSPLAGSGTTDDPYVISSCLDLQQINNALSSTYILSHNIDCSDTINWNNGEGFLPIGQSGGWSGELDGKGYKISDLYINTSAWGAGLFSWDNSSKIYNLGLENETVISSNEIVGGLIGSTFQGTISNCYVTGTISGGAYVGGLVGGHESGDTIVNSYSTADVSGFGGIGGLVGWNTNSGVIANSYATGNVNGVVDIGGFVGYNNGQISNSYSTGNVSGYADTGGFAGENAYTISESYSTGDVVGNSYSDSTNNIYIGGFVGENYNPILNSFSTSHVLFYNGTANTPTPLGGDTYVGNFIGENFVGTLANNAYDQTNAGQAFCEGDGTPRGTGGQGCGGTTAVNTDGTDSNHFKNTSAVAPLSSWNFYDLWQTNDNAYPTLQAYLTAPFSGAGLGTADSPYLITTCSQFEEMDKFNLLSSHFKLQNNLDCSGEGNYIEIGTIDPFSGVFDGNSHTITVAINDTTSDNVGLFMRTSGATIENIKVYGTVAGIGLNNGALVGYMNASSIVNSGSNVNITVNSNFNWPNVGGLVGGMENTSTITGSNSIGSVSVSGYEECVGGLVGYSDSSNINTSYAKGDIVSSGSSDCDVAGFVGHFTSGQISQSYSSGNVSTDSWAGGFVGYLYNSQVDNSYAAGNVNESDTNGAGGFVGFDTINTYNQTYSTGNIVGNGNSSYGGGFIGNSNSGNDVINNSFSTGAVSGFNNRVGGFIGYYDGGGSSSNNFFDQANSGQTSCVGSGSIGSCTAVNIDGTDGNHFKGNHSVDPFSTWDFTATPIWDVVSNGYPVLSAFSGPVLTEFSAIPSSVSLSDAKYYFRTSKTCSLDVSPISSSVNGNVSVQVSGHPEPGQDFYFYFSGLQAGGTYSFNFNCIDNFGNQSNTLYVGPFTVANSGSGHGLRNGGIGDISNSTAVTPSTISTVPTGGQVANPLISLNKNLSYGVTNNVVYYLQVFLNTHGFIISKTGAGSPGQENNYFGLKTCNALKKFQKANNILSTGTLGPKTRLLIAKMIGGGK